MALTNALQYIRFNASLLLLKLSHGEPPTPICLIFFSYLPKIKRDLKTWAAMASTKVQRIMIQLIKDLGTEEI
ncbi:unnamed protein product [Brassica rapa subsp. trilocularis]